MTKKQLTISLVLLIIFGSLTTFYGMNLLMSDLANMFYTSLNKDILSSFPFFIIALDFILATIFVIRLYKHFDQKRALINLYSNLLVINSIAGIICSLLSGWLVYHDFLAPYPFPYYVIICIVIHVVLLVVALWADLGLKKKFEEDTDHRKVKPKYVGYTIVLWLLTLFSYNRLGALLFAPIYMQMRTLDLTFPFYISLLLPFVLLMYVMGNFLGWFKQGSKMSVVFPIIVLVLDIIFCAWVVYLGTSNTQFISAISPALGLERLATMPVDTILQFGGIGLLSIYYAIFAALYNKKIAKHQDWKPSYETH